jgi:hypothetical protein
VTPIDLNFIPLERTFQLAARFPSRQPSYTTFELPGWHRHQFVKAIHHTDMMAYGQRIIQDLAWFLRDILLIVDNLTA